MADWPFELFQAGVDRASAFLISTQTLIKDQARSNDMKMGKECRV